MTSELRDQLQSTLGSSYTLERELEGGGMSRVFVAEDTALGRAVVVKVPWLIGLETPEFQPLRADQRYTALLRRMGLETRVAPMSGSLNR